jgi:imidazolonepropionase-like amidohydrolase
MKKNKFIALSFSLLLTFISFGQSKVTVFSNVNILPMDKKEVIKNQTVIVTDGVITAIKANEKAKAKIPADAAIIDGKGYFLMPGLADMHAHFPGENGDKFDTEKYLALQLAAGVTSIRAMRDEPNLMELRNKIQAGTVLGPKLYLSAILPLKTEPSMNKLRIETLVADYKKQGYDQVKYLSGGNDEQLKDLSVACQKTGIRLVGHAPKGSFEQSIALKMASVEHVTPLVGAYKLGTQKFEDIVQSAIKNKVFICPTLNWYSVYYNQLTEADLRKRAGLAYVPSDVMDVWNKDLKESTEDKTAAAKAKADGKLIINNGGKAMMAFVAKGGKLLIGGDDGMFIVPGFSMLDEMRSFTKAGFSTFETLRAATYNAAEYWGEADNWGIRKGKQANFILVAANPLDNIENMSKVEGVFFNNQWKTKAELLEKAK